MQHAATGRYRPSRKCDMARYLTHRPNRLTPLIKLTDYYGRHIHMRRKRHMYRTILVPTDGTPLSDKAISAAVQFAAAHPGCRIIGITVVEPLPLTQLETFTTSLTSDYLDQERRIAEACVRRIADLASEAGVPCETVIAQSSKPHEEIVRAAAAYRCDCIFMASNGRKGLNRLFIGSETQKVLATATIPVMVYR